MAKGKKNPIEIIHEESEGTHTEQSSSEQQLEALLEVFEERVEFKYFDLQCITKEGKEVKNRIYLSNRSTSFWFQFCYLEFRGLRALDKIDERFLLGDAMSPAKVVKQFRILPKIDKLQDKSLATITIEDSSTEPIADFALPPDTKNLPLTHSLELDYFLPNDENFLDSDYKELEDFLGKRGGPKFYSKGVIEKGRHNSAQAFSYWRQGALEEKCIPSLCMTLRLAENTEDPAVLESIVESIIEVAVSSGIYYSTQIDRKENHPSLIYNLAVMMDCCPTLKKQILVRLAPLIKHLMNDSTDLFSLEKLASEEPEMMRLLILYLVTELNRMDKKFYLALTFLEYFVQVAGDRCTYGLVLGDLLDMINENDVTTKIYAYYVKAYKSEDSFVSTTALSRLSIIYQFNFLKTLKDSPNEKKLHIDLYVQLWETNQYLAKVSRLEAMRFMVDHYIKGLCFICKEKDLIMTYHREVENLLMNRKVALEFSLEYFDYFFVMGDRGEILLTHFEVMKFLKYLESSLIALRYAVLNVDTLSYSRRYFMMAICKKEGLGSEPDLGFAFRVLKSYYVELISTMSYSNTLDTAICLTHIADIMEKLDQTESCKQLRLHALLFAVYSDEYYSQTKKFLYYISHMLRKLGYFPDHEATIKLEGISTELDVIDIWNASFYISYSSSEDHIYHYMIERCMSENLFQFDNLKSVTKRLYDKSPERSRFLAQFAYITSNITSVEEISYTETLKETLGGVKKKITNEGKIQLTVEYIESKVSPVIDACNTYFENNQTTIAAQPDISTEKLSGKIIRKVNKNLTILANKEKQVTTTDKSVERLVQSNLKDLSKAMFINNLEEHALTVLKRYPIIRILHDSEIEMDEEKPLLKFFYRAYVYSANFTINKQACKVFRIEIFDQNKLNTFLENITWMTTVSPFILNYFGLRFKPGKEALSIDIVSEDFEGFAWPNDNLKIWTTTSISLNMKFNMFDDLLMAVRSLHFIGKPHLFLTSGHMVVCKGSTRLKVIVPFFMDYFSDPSLFMRSVTMPDMVYVSPKIMQANIFPKKEADLFSENMTDATYAFLNSDIWSIGVVLVEILSGQAFGVGEHVGNYKMAIKKKSKVQDIVEYELKRVKKKYPDKRIPIPDLSAYFMNNHVDRPSITRTIRFLSEFIKSEFNFNLNIDKKFNKDFFLRSYFDNIEFYRDEDLEQLTLRGNEPIRLYLWTNLDFMGMIDAQYIPKGRCLIKRGRTHLIDAEFEDGVPCVALSLSNRKGEHVNVAFKNGRFETCMFTSAMNEFESRDLFPILNVNQLIPSRDHLIREFEPFRTKKSFEQLLEEFKKDKKFDFQDKPETLLDNLAQNLLGRHRESLKRSAKKEDSPDSMKKQLKDLGVSDSSSDEESAKAKALKEGAQSRRLKLQKYDHGKIEDQIDRILLYRDLLLDKREQRKKPTEDYETFMNRSKESVEVSDPFGYIYDILYNSHSDNFFYNKGRVCFIRYQPKELQTRLLQ